MKVRYTHITHSFRKENNLSLTEYTFCDMVNYLSKNRNCAFFGWCSESKKEIAEEIGLSRQAVHDLINKMEKCGLIVVENKTGFLQTTAKWDLVYLEKKEGDNSKVSLHGVRDKSRVSTDNGVKKLDRSVKKLDTECKETLLDLLIDENKESKERSNSDFEKKSQTEIIEVEAVEEVFEEKKQPKIPILNGRQSKKKVAPKKKEPDLFGDFDDGKVVAELWPSFEDFWALYDKKTGKEKSIQKWAKLKQSEKEQIMQHVPDYVASQPDKTYRKNPETYLNGKCWNDEIIVKGGKKDNISYFYTEEGFKDLLNSALK